MDGGAAPGSSVTVSGATTSLTVGANAKVETADFSAGTGTVNAGNALTITKTLKVPGTTIDSNNTASFTLTGANVANNSSARTITLYGGKVSMTTGNPADPLPSIPGLVGYWPLNETAGTTATDIIGGHNGTLTGTVPPQPWVQGNNNNAVTLGPTNSLGYVHVGSLGSYFDNGKASRTISGWVKLTGPNQGGWTNIFGFAGTGGGQFFDMEVEGPNVYGLHNHGQDNPLPAPAGNLDLDWHFFAATLSADGLSETVYKDGVLVQTWNTPGNLNIVNNFEIGKRPDQNCSLYGTVDDVRVYNRALTAAEVAALYGYTGFVQTNFANTNIVSTTTSELDMVVASANHTLGSLSITAKAAPGNTLTLSNAARVTFSGGISAVGSSTGQLYAAIAGTPGIVIPAGQNIEVYNSHATPSNRPKATLTILSPIVGASVVNKTDVGVLVLDAANTYTGPTTINAGTLKISVNGDLGATSSLTIADALLNTTKSLSLNAPVTTTSANSRIQMDNGAVLTLNGAISGPALLVGTVGSTNPLPGTMLVNGTSNAPITVRAGSFGGRGILAGGLTANSTTTLLPGGASAMGTLSASSVTLNSNNIGFELGAFGTSDRIAVGGTLTANGLTLLNFPTRFPGLVPRSYSLITFGTGPEDATGFEIGEIGLDTAMTVGNLRIEGNALLADIGLDGVPLKTWTGAGADGDWNTTGNWFDTDFADGDSVQFNNVLAPNHTNITVSGTVKPASMLFDHSINYAVGGAGVLADPDDAAFGTPLEKTGSGILTLGNPSDPDMQNTFSGGVSVSGGTLSVRTLPNAGLPGPLGTGTLTLGGLGTRGTLQYTGVTASTTRGLIVTGSGGAVNVGSGVNLDLSGVITGQGGLEKSGDGTLTLSGQVVPTGVGTLHSVTGGTLALTNKGTPANNFNGNTISIAAGAILDAWGASEVDTNSLANATVRLAGGRFVARGVMPTSVQANTVSARMYRQDGFDGNNVYIDFGAGTDALTIGRADTYGIYRVTRELYNNGGTDWKNYYIRNPLVADDPSNFEVIFNGFFAPSQTGTYGFSASADDASAFALDCNGDGDFRDPGEATNVAWDAQPRPLNFNLTAGKMYRVAMGSREGGGGDWARYWVRVPGSGTDVAINPGTGNAGTWYSADQWNIMLAKSNFLSTAVEVTADSILDVQSMLGADFGAMTWSVGTKLTVPTAAAAFTSTTFTGFASPGAVTLDNAASVGLGVLNAGTNALTLTKINAGTLVLNGTDAAAAFSADSTIVLSGTSAGAVSVVGLAGGTRRESAWPRQDPHRFDGDQRLDGVQRQEHHARDLRQFADLQPERPAQRRRVRRRRAGRHRQPRRRSQHRGGQRHDARHRGHQQLQLGPQRSAQRGGLDRQRRQWVHAQARCPRDGPGGEQLRQHVSQRGGCRLERRHDHQQRRQRQVVRQGRPARDVPRSWDQREDYRRRLADRRWRHGELCPAVERRRQCRVRRRRQHPQHHQHDHAGCLLRHGPQDGRRDGRPPRAQRRRPDGYGIG